MMIRMLALAGVLLAAAPAAGQRTISPGMTDAQVRSILGPPATTRSTPGWTYLYYHNGCPVRCGSDDVVFLRDGRVVAAVFRTGARRFAGPAPDDALQQAGGAEPSEPAEEPAVVGGIRVRPAQEEETTVFSRQGTTGGGRTVIIRSEDEGDPARPLRRAGSREAAAGDEPPPLPRVPPAAPDTARQP